MESETSVLRIAEGLTDLGNTHPVVANNQDHDQDSESDSSSDEDGEGESEETGESGAESSDAEQGNNNNGVENEWSDESESSLPSSEGVPVEDELRFPPVLPSNSVKVMTESVGCSVPEVAAAALGHLTMNKLRGVVMIADQLRKHDQCQGLGVEHFSMAEKLTQTQSFGHKSTYILPNFKHVWKGMSVLESSPPIDLFNTIQQARKHPKPLRRITALSLNEHQLQSEPVCSDLYQHEEAPISSLGVGDNSLHESSKSESSESSYFESDEGKNPRTIKSKQRIKRNELKRPELLARRKITKNSKDSSSLPAASKLENLLEKILVLNEEEMEAKRDNETAATSETIANHNSVIAGIEWIDYMKVFMHSFFAPSDAKSEIPKIRSPPPQETTVQQDGKSLDSSNSTKYSDKDSSHTMPCFVQRARKKQRRSRAPDFKYIINDLNANGVFPVFNILLNFFDDYMHGKFNQGRIGLDQIRKILDVVGASLRCPVEINQVYLEKTFKTLTTVMAFPPVCELHSSIAQLFVLLVKKAPNDFSVEVILWTCQYVTETLIWCRDSCLHSPELNITLFNLAVTFSNALEESGVHMILELEWDQLILEFLQGFQHLQVQTKASEVRNVNALSGSKSVETSTNTQKDILLIPELEETLLVFIQQLLRNYGEKLSSGTIERIKTIVLGTFGEKLIPFLAKRDALETLECQKKRKTTTATLGLPIKNRWHSSGKRLRSIHWNSRRFSIGKIPGKVCL